MKIVNLILCCFLMAGCSTQQKNPNSLSNLYGNWQSEDRMMSMVFQPPNKFKIGVGTVNGGGTFEANFRKTPAHLDITNEGGGIIKTIFEMTAPDKFKMENTEPGRNRPKQFSDEAVIFTKTLK